MNNIVYIVTVCLIKDSKHQLEVPKVFTDKRMADRYQDNINTSPIYQNINAFAFCEPAIMIEE